MSKLKVAVLSAAVVTGIGAAGALTATVANAQSTGDTLVERIASRFNLNSDEVQEVFDQAQDERQAEQLTDFSEDLQDKVDDGDITAEQKTLIENKAKELQDQREAERDELETWAEQNGIDTKYLFWGFKGANQLDDAVEDGDITAEQRTLIEQKQDELEQRRETQRDELDQWAEDNDVELSDLRLFGHGFGGRGFMKF